MKKIKEISIALLLLILIVGGVFLFKINKENQQYVSDIAQEKLALQEELDIALSDLTSNQEQNIAITKNFNETNDRLKQIRVSLEKSKKEIKGLKKELLTTQEKSFSALKKLRSSLTMVKINNQLLFKSLDSIKVLNDSLMVEIAITKSDLNAEKLQTKELNFKLSEATKIQIAKVEVFAIQKKKSGKVKRTTKHKNTNGIQVSYNVLNNKALANVECDVYYLLKKEDGEIVKANGTFLLNATETEFTDGTRLILNGETMPVSNVILLDNVVLKKGTYILEFYSVDGLLAKESFELKNSFLGVF